MLSTLAILAFSACLQITTARPRGKRKPALEVKEGLFVLGIVLTIVMAVPIILTIYRMYYDPLTPHLWRIVKKSIRAYFSTPVEARQAQDQTLSSRQIATQMYQKSMAKRAKASDKSLRQRPSRPVNPPQYPPIGPLTS